MGGSQPCSIAPGHPGRKQADPEGLVYREGGGGGSEYRPLLQDFHVSISL